MRVFSYSEARQNFARVLSLAQHEEIEIRRRDGSIFSLKAKKQKTTSPFDVPGIKTQVSTLDILDAIRESRSDFSDEQA